MDQAHSRPRALAVVAEDELLTRMETSDFLVEEGFDVTDAAQALAAIERMDGVDLLFTDVRMPGGQEGLI